ncbi:hypothetical protein HDEF_0707 [Candidatus Hamiltonella defensa 5AT (Acyrthosiphon pisum)]|uniref:Uncharacterized protein n=1 Tax=Hamiltonella defensa subsp. Acyrthosiphon pisum (strain 5AT) TaxID=572265 RepID=C4K4E7_HAMD5|nr:hypothetical protein HDEF_0707 [Candidatus Hamiltonella defensa 5AT (Acyrthosiphon pisum)]
MFIGDEEGGEKVKIDKVILNSSFIFLFFYFFIIILQ